jgi:glutamine cyclotransferase
MINKHYLSLILVLLATGCFAQLNSELDARLHFSPVFTQGLIIHDNTVWESSGLYGKSMLTKWNLKTGRILKQRKFDDNYFAEGLTELNGRLFMITWKENTAFEIDKDSLQILKTYKYHGEGWGLTSDGKQLIMSNGTAEIQFINAQNFKTTRTIKAHIGDVNIPQLNELEWIEGEIWANVYQTDYIVVIDPISGEITNKYYLPNLLKGRKPGVLNGIAFDKATKKTWVTGKNWPMLFQL